MEFENGTYTSHGPQARAEENARRVPILEQRIRDLKARLAKHETVEDAPEDPDKPKDPNAPRPRFRVFP
jgi:hypothetical protein